MSVASYLSSFLLVQREKLSDAKFGGAWLYWEPGHWQAPRGGESTVSVRKTVTLPPVPAVAPQPQPTSDTLCFRLGAPDDRVLRIGRDPESDLVVSDATVSRLHAELFSRSGHWCIRGSVDRAVKVNGLQVPAEGAELVLGCRITVGSVAMTFHDLPSLLNRLARGA